VCPGKQFNFAGDSRFVMFDITITWNSWSPLDREPGFGGVRNPMIALLTWVSLFHLFERLRQELNVELRYGGMPTEFHSRGITSIADAIIVPLIAMECKNMFHFYTHINIITGNHSV